MKTDPNRLSKSKKRIHQIDLFRFLAAISVVFFHYFFRGYAADNLSNLDFGDVGGFLKYGYLGVNIFFIISGFVISLSIKDRSLLNFVISRISRLYPIYWISVLFTGIVIAFFGGARYTVEFNQLILNFTMFQNYMGIDNIDGVYWTLFVEMKFYIFIVGLYLLVNKLKTIKLDYLVYLWLLLSVLYIFFFRLFIFKILGYFFILDWSSYFLAGIIFYQIFKTKLDLKNAILLAISFSISIYHSISDIEMMVLKYNTSFSPFIICSWITIFYLLMLLVSCNKLSSINSPKLVWIGMLTYPLYLIHQNIGFIIFNNLDSYLNKYLLVILTIIFMIILSFILSKFFEPKVSSCLRSRMINLSTKYIKGTKI